MDKENETLIDQLLFVRATLAAALYESDFLELKLRGPIAATGDKGQQAPSSDSICSVTHEIRELSLELLKSIAANHTVLGSFALGSSTQLNQQNRGLA